MASMRDYLKGNVGQNHDARGSSKFKIGLFGGLLALLLASGVGLYWTGRSVLVPTDPDTLCPRSRAPSEILVLLLDMSDAYSEAQRLQIRNELERIRATVRQFGLIVAYAVDRLGARITKPVIHLCNPGSDRDVNRVYQNPKMAQQRWNKFSDALDAELERLMSTEESSTSPIFEAVQSAALQTLNLPKFDNVPKRLVVVSDLLQNVPGRLNQYRDTTIFSEWKKLGYFSDVRADLTGVQVQLLYLVRSGTPQNSEHWLFWEGYFRAQGASVSEIVPIYGAH